MATELIITSVPKGLKPGSYGFCTAACTKDLNEPTSRALEVISGYRHLFSSEEGKANPVAFSYLLYEFAGRQRRVLSRVADMGLDYSGRTNKIAHHLVLSEDEKAKCDAGPAALCAGGVFMERWPEDEQPHYLDARTVFCVESINLNAIKTGAWQKLTGDPGWAGVLAGTVLTRRPVVLIVRPEQDVLTLFREALVLLKPDERWKATFSTYYTSLPANAQCQWRALVDGAYDEKLLRNQNALTLDLRNPGALPRVDETTLTPQEKPLVDLARGVASARAEAPQSWEPLGLTPEEAPRSGRKQSRYPSDPIFYSDTNLNPNNYNSIDDSYALTESQSGPYMPPSHKKSTMIWVLIGFLAGLVILAVTSLTLWLMLESKNGGEPTKPDDGAAAQTTEESSSAGKPDKEKKGDDPGDKEDGESPSPKGDAESDKETNPPTDEKSDGKTEQTPNNEDESQPAEEENLLEEEPEQHSANPDVLKLEEQWNKLKEEKNFDKTVLFVEGQRSDIGRLYEELNGDVNICNTFFKKYDERKSEEIDSISDLCEQIADAHTAAEKLANKFDFELFQKKCEFAVQGMDQIIALYNEALSDKDLKHRSSTLKGMNDALIKAHFAEAKSKSSDDKSDDGKKDEEIENLAGGLTPIRNEIDSIYQRSKKEVVDDLNGIKPRVSEFPDIRLKLEEEIIEFIVKTVDAKHSFSVFTEGYRTYVDVKIDGKKQGMYSWHAFGDGEEDDFRKGMKAYVDYCMNSENEWACTLTFTFAKTPEIDSQEKTIEYSPNKGGEYFPVEVDGNQVLLGVKGRTEEDHQGSFVFYISDPQSIRSLLLSARTRLSFASKTNPEAKRIESCSCQLHKPIDLAEIVKKSAKNESGEAESEQESSENELEQLLGNCVFISDSDFKKLKTDSKNKETENKNGLPKDAVLCIVACDKEGRIRDGSDAFSLTVSVIGDSEKESDGEDESEKVEKILFQFSRTADRGTDDEDVTLTYKADYTHKLLKERRKNSYQPDYEKNWKLIDEKIFRIPSSDVPVEADFIKETPEQWQKKFGTGNLLFYLVRPGEEDVRANWLLYVKTPYNVFEYPQ